MKCLQNQLQQPSYIIGGNSYLLLYQNHQTRRLFVVVFYTYLTMFEFIATLTMHLVGIKNIFDRKFFRNLNKFLLFDEV